MIYTIQASKTGWTLYRGAGITQTFRLLSTAKMIIEDCGGSLIVLDKAGNRLN